MMRENRYPNYPTLLREMAKMDIAGTFNFSQKTLQRDVEYLKEEFNAPIKYDYSKRGYYLTNPDWTWECPLLDADAMKASLLGARLAETMLPEPLRGSIRKAVDRQLMNNEKGLDENVALESLVAVVNHRGLVDPVIFGLVFAAWEGHRTLRVNYTKIGYSEVKDFTVEPHVLTLFDGCWYIKGKLIRKGDWDCAEWGYPDMVLALPRIKSAEILETTFETDQRIVDEVVSGKLFSLEEVHNVSLRVEGISACYVKEQFPHEKIGEDVDGAMVLHISSAVKFTLIKWILGEGGNVTVITPRSLASEVAAQAAELAEKQKARLNASS
jgi:predicted DNA-binding transcriptional regulator YafY